MTGTPQFDVLVIGSGPSGSHAAAEAAATGCKVALLDVGFTDTRYENLIPEKSFSEIRRTDAQQQLYFLGENPEAALRAQGRAGPHLTPARQHMIRNMDALFPLESDTFLPLQATGLGGLGISWGANCFALEDFELERIGIGGSLRQHYNAAAKEAGVSGRMDDALTPLIANLDASAVQPPLPLDSNAETILERYERKEAKYKEQGFYVGQSLLAMLSRAQDGRQANPQADMDFWADFGRSVYRPRYTVEKLKKLDNFTHLTGRMAVRFEDGEGGATVECRAVESGGTETFTARKVLLAAGAINSGRLALASFQDYQARLPILCNPNHWVAALNLSMLGRPARDQRHSLSQLTVMMRAAAADGPDYILAQLYSYRSLLLFRLLKDIPLPPKQALLFLRLIATAFTCVNIHFPDRPSADRYLKLEPRASGDVLTASCKFSDAELGWLKQHESRMLKFLVSLRCIPMGVTNPIHGASIHYAGSLPYAADGRPFTTSEDGRLSGTRNVYVADGSSWRFMPAKGLTLTLMANARRVAQQAVRDLAAVDSAAR